MSPSQVVDISSHINDRWLKAPEREEKTMLIKKRLHATEKKNDYLVKKIRDLFDTKSIDVDNSLHAGLHNIIQEHSEKIQRKYQPNTFHLE